MSKRPNRIVFLSLLVGLLLGVNTSARAADVINNGDFQSDLSNWTATVVNGVGGTITWDGTWGGVAAGSARLASDAGRNTQFTGTLEQSIGTLSPGQTVSFSMTWYKDATDADPGSHDLQVILVHPDLSETVVLENLAVPTVGGPLQGSWSGEALGGFITQTGEHRIKIYHFSKNGRTNNASARTRVDDIIVDVSGGNSAPSLSAGTTSVTPGTITVPIGSTTLSATFSDTDDPGIGAFSVTFSVREPNNSTVVNVVNAAAHGTSGVTIVNNGGGSYTASVSWTPGAGTTLGAYDLYFQVSDGAASATDDYASNLDELTLQNATPVVTAGSTTVSPASIQAQGAYSTTLTGFWSDAGLHAVSEFSVTFRVRQPDNTTVVNIVTAATNGTNGVTITDLGGGSYQATVDWDPADAQVTGLYDLYFEVNDGIESVADGYASNLDELTLLDPIPNEPPVIVAGNTSTSPNWIYRSGASSTVISATFTDADAPPVGDFTVSFFVRRPDNASVITLANALGHGAGGVTIVDNGGGSYTASLSWNPADDEIPGFYDLRFVVSDGIDNAVDDYAANLDELELRNRVPAITAGAVSASPLQVNRLGAFTTTISADFTDADVPALTDFTVTFRVREPDNSTVVSIVESVADGVSGVTIVDNGGGSYTASLDWDPGDTQAIGLYDLYFSVSDGYASIADGYTNNTNEIDVIELIVNNPPVIVAGATSASPTSIDRVGGATTTLSVAWSDADVPGVPAFFVDLIAQAPFGGGQYDVALNLQNGQGGLVITDLGSGDYSASISWDPPDDAPTGYYALQARVSDGEDSTYDVFANNQSDLLITTGGENQPPIVPSDEVFASPAAVPRVGANPTTIAATFTDADAPAITTFLVTFKVREPDNTTEIVLANAAAHGTGGVTIVDQGSGIYTASITWDPADAQTAGFYDLYFEVSDGALSSVDQYIDNLDELQLFDDIPNQAPTLVAGSTEASPTTVTRFGSDYTMLRTTFNDPDEPGFGTFTVTLSVREPGGAETIVVNAATHGFQGLRVRSLGGGDYDAAVLWDPPVGQITGAYDLKAVVQDAGGLSVTDDYADNSDELTVTATGVAGDGYLLRRTHNADGCGGPSSGCHDILGHQGQDCLVCHTPHGSSNIYMVKETITTPISGDKSVILKTLGIGDAYNPSPTAGDPNSGALADDSDGVFTGVCEVCHISTKYHRNDGTQPVFGHYNAEMCVGCHSHAEGFPRPEGAAESSGGQACTCHSGIVGSLTPSDSAYHHLLSSGSADYTISSKTCLMCHVDHDIFRPDLNTGVGERAKNLRVDITTPVVQGDASVLANSDYLPTGAGGICLACHVNSQTKGYPQPDGTTQTPVINKTDYDAATTSHNFSVPTQITTDSSTFNANCVKCHDDRTASSYQTGNAFSTHSSPLRRILNAFDTVSPTDPVEESHCFGCHSTTSNPNAGANQDYFGVKTMSSAALALETVLGYTYAHPIGDFSGRHKPIEGASDLADGATRHVECMDCHNVHAARAGNHDGSTNLVSNPLKGTWGVEPTSWPAAPTPSNNANVFVGVPGYTRVEPAQKEYQICLKCHSDFTTLPAGARNLAEEINPNYASNHGIVSPGTNPFCNTTTMHEPWASSGIAWCSDCHRSNNPSDPGGAHGSNLEHMLVATVTSNDAVGTPLCFVCHKETEYWSGSVVGSRYSKHPPAQGNHARPQGCFACHMWEYSSTPGLGVANQSENLADGQIFVHGMNKRHTFNEQDGSAGFGTPVDAFVNGYIADMDYAAKKCWVETCKGHSGQAY